MSIKTDQGSGHGGGGHGQDDGSGQGQGIVGVVCQTSAWIILIDVVYSSFCNFN